MNNGTMANVNTTQMYYPEPSTTEELVFVPIIPDDNDPIKEFGCDYQWMGSFTNENIEITICGYTEEMEDEEDSEEIIETEYVAITLDIPSERWTAFGIKTGDLDSEDGFENYMGYNIIIPYYSDDIDEIYYDSDKMATDLQNVIEIYSDEITSLQRRIIRLVRTKFVGYEHVNNTADNLKRTEDDKLYFDFANFDECGESVIISVQYGSEDKARFSKYGNIISDDYQHREAATENLDEEDGEECMNDSDTDEYDHASRMMIFGALIIGFMGMLLST